MTLHSRIRYFIILVSVIIFCYQFKVALNNLKSKATVDSTEYVQISDLDSPPVITFCPRQPINEGRLMEWGWGAILRINVNFLMQGKIPQLSI